MPARKKTMLEKVLSWNRHARRLGALGFFDCDMSIQEMIEKKVEGVESRQIRGSRRDLSSHIHELRLEFIGRTELEFRHATLIVLLRRGYKTRQVYKQYLELWQQAGDSLLKNLNLRWLCSAADTIADHDPDPVQRSLSLAASCLINTVKLTESERFLTDSEHKKFFDEKVHVVQSQLVPLGDGMSCFTVGTDDTIRNLRWRIDSMGGCGIAGMILIRSFQRMQEVESVYMRFKESHHRSKTSWWD